MLTPALFWLLSFFAVVLVKKAFTDRKILNVFLPCNQTLMCGPIINTHIHQWGALP